MTEEATVEGFRSDRLEVADRLHSAAIHLLRRVRRRDVESGLSAARLSALSVLVFRDGTTMGDLARAEQVSLPTISRMVASLERAGLVRREKGNRDQRIVHLRATAQGTEALQKARRRRVQDLADQLRSLPPQDLEALRRATEILDRLLSEES